MPWERFGDLLPLPLPAYHGHPGPACQLRSRRSQQRVNRRLRGFIEECDTVRAVNRLGGFSDEGGWPFCPLNQAQRAALQRIHAAHCDRPKPAEQQSSQAALRQLLKQGSSYGGPGELASFVRDQVSLPRNQGSPVSLLEILPEEERTMLEDFEAAMMLTPEERGAIIEKGLDNLCHMDPVLANSKKKYHQFVADMFTSGLIGFTTEPRSQIGAFVVTKKNGKQRLIVDARRTNRLFRTPPSTLLGSMECWGRLESDSEFFVAQEDVKDFFYRLGIPLELGRFFCFPCIDPHALQTEIGYMPEDLRALVHRDGRGVFPCMKVLPMGFSWAFHLAHQAHVEITKRALPRTPQIKDKAVMPRFGEGKHRAATGALIYADNNNHIGVQRQAVEQEHTTMLGALAQHGLDYHEVIEATSLAESLGVRVDGLTGRISATSARDWRLHKALEALILRPSISGEEFQKIVGHLTIRAMMHRGLMSILRHVYTFIEQCYSQRTRLWQSVADELWLFKSLMVLGLNESFTPWDPWLLCTDASLTGYAVMESKYHMEDAGVIGRRDERWRFKKEKGKPRKAPREVALEGLDVFEDLRTVLPIVEGEVAQDLEVDSSFIDVDPKLLQQDNWKCLWRTPVRFKEPIHQIEARSILGAVKHRSRDSNKHSHRIVILNDNMGVCLAFQKGRCSNFGLLRIIRRVSAHLLCTGIRLSVRWVPSELNVADEDSRFWERSMGSGTKKFPQKRRVAVFTKEFARSQNAILKLEPEHPPSLKRKREVSPAADTSRRVVVGGLGKIVRSHKKKREKALARKKKYAKQVRGEKTLLEHASIKEPARKDYYRKLEGFYAFVVKYELTIRSEESLDAALCEYAEHLFLDGEDSHYGQKLQAALEYDRPEFSREGRLALPRFKRALKGWRKLAPTQTRLPMPEMLKSCVSAIFLQMGWKEEALYNEVTFSTYARPGEMMRVMAEDVVAPNQEFNHAVIILEPLERGESSKVGIYDEVLVLDDKRAPWLPKLVLKHAQSRMSTTEDRLLWSFNAAGYLKKWRQAVQMLGMEEIAVSPYQNRHGGASRDHLKKLRSIPEIQRRGRWNTDSSARIYDKPGRLQQTLNLCGEKYSALGEEMQCRFDIFFQSGCQALPKRLGNQLRNLCKQKCS